jgi:hypothetical protein
MSCVCVCVCVCVIQYSIHLMANPSNKNHHMYSSCDGILNFPLKNNFHNIN